MYINYNSNFEILNCIFFNNTSQKESGGGIYFTSLSKSSTLIVTDSLFWLNSAPQQEGGAILSNQIKLLVIKNSSFIANSAKMGGALTINPSSNDIQIPYKIIDSSEPFKPRIYQIDYDKIVYIYITNSLFEFNYAYKSAGAIDLDFQFAPQKYYLGPPRINQTRFISNHARYGGAAMRINGLNET